MRTLGTEYMQPCSSLCSQTATASCGGGAAPPAAAPAAPHQHLQFLQGWKSHIAPRLQQLLVALQTEEVATSLAIAQVRQPAALPPRGQGCCRSGRGAACDGSSGLLHPCRCPAACAASAAVRSWAVPRSWRWACSPHDGRRASAPPVLARLGPGAHSSDPCSPPPPPPQVWTYLPVLTEGRQVLKAEQLCLLGDAELQAFHGGCAHEGVTVGQLGPMGKVWESGAVQVVQCVGSLADDSHPRNRLPGALSGRIGECVYVPVYDSTGTGSGERCCCGWQPAAAAEAAAAWVQSAAPHLAQPPCPFALVRLPHAVSQGVLAVVELLIRAGAADYMIVANAISCLCALLEPLQLSLSNPHAPASPPPSSGSPAKPGAQACGAAGLSRSGGSGGALGRSCSMRTFC